MLSRQVQVKIFDRVLKDLGRKNKKKQNLRARKQKMEFSQIFTGDAGNLLRQVRTRTVYTAGSASRDALCNTQRVRPCKKLKEKQKLTNSEANPTQILIHTVKNQKIKSIFSEQSSHKGKDFHINGPQRSHHFVMAERVVCADTTNLPRSLRLSSDKQDKKEQSFSKYTF